MATDLSKACWCCTYWASFAHPQANHSPCSRVNASLMQASPATGCASRTPGSGDGHPPDWTPPGFRLVKGPDTWGQPLELLPLPADQGPRRPGVPHEQFAFDRAVEASAWHATDALLSRAAREG